MEATIQQAHEAARDFLNYVLETDASLYDHFDGLKNMPAEMDAFYAIDKLVDTKKEIVQYGERIKREVDSAIEYASGRRGSMNSLGVLQSDGVRFDMNAALFHERYESARKAVAAAILQGWTFEKAEGQS